MAVVMRSRVATSCAAYPGSAPSSAASRTSQPASESPSAAARARTASARPAAPAAPSPFAKLLCAAQNALVPGFR